MTLNMGLSSIIEYKIAKNWGKCMDMSNEGQMS